MNFNDAPFQLAGLFDFLEDVLAWVKDREGHYLWVNHAFLLKFTLEHPDKDGLGAKEQVLGKSDYDLSPAFLADQFRLDDEQVLAGHRVVNRIERVLEADGTVGWSLTNKIPVRNARGKVIGTAGTTRMLTHMTPPKMAGPDFGPVLAHMRDCYAQPISNVALARIAKTSVRTFERQFLASFHVTPQKYLRKLRLGIASRSLIYTQQSLSELALACGFGDQSHFTRAFRQQFGRTPRAYREHYRSAAAAFGTKSAAAKQDSAAVRC